MKKTQTLSASLKRLEEWLQKNRSAFLKSLVPGATAAEIAKCEKRIGAPLPDALRTLLAWRNGQDEDESQGYFEESWLFMGTRWIAAVKTELDAHADEAGWPTAWIPFLDNDQGDYLCLDASKREPPVYAFWIGTKEQQLVAESLSEWMWRFVDGVENGAYVEDEERGRFMRTTD